MDPQRLRPESSNPNVGNPTPPRVQRPEMGSQRQSEPPAGPGSTKPGPQLNRRSLLAALAVGVAAVAIGPRLFHKAHSSLPVPSGQVFGPEYRSATLAAQAAPTTPMPTNVAEWHSCLAGTPGGPLSDIDMALVVDTTGSMGPVLNDLKASMARLVSTLASVRGRARVGIVAYRDTGDDYVVNQLPLTDLRGPGFGVVQLYLQTLQAYGGGDWPEKIDAALDAAAHMQWRPDVPASIVIVADAPAHEADQAAASRIAQNFASALPAGHVSVVDTGSGADPFLRDLPGKGRGQYITYDGDILKSLYPAITACPSR